MERSIYRFIFRYSMRQQVFILLVTVASLPFLYYSLDLPKQIVNDAIGGRDFPQDFFGLELEQIPFLLVLSLIFLALVIINGAFKYYINVYKGRLGERMLRRLRYELYSRVLRFRLPRFKRMSQGEIIPMVTSEVEPLGGFIGDAIALPAYQAGMLLTYLFFIMMQDWILGIAAISLYPIQGYIIPKLQKRVNQLGKARVQNIRQLADRIGESVAGVQEIHAHDTARLHGAEIAERLARNYDIRYEIFKRKFFIKFLNNFLNQLTPFFFYSIGGYLVISGELTFGALVAVLAAYKDLASPWKELLTYYQMREDVRIKYEQVVEQFQPADMQDSEQLGAEADPFEGKDLPDHWSFKNVTYGEEDSPPDIEGLNLELPTDRHMVVLGDGSSGRDTLMLLLGRLLVPTGGRIELGDHDYASLPESVAGRRITYVGPSTHMFTGSLRENLYYGLNRKPETQPDDWDAEGKARAWEAVAAGNPVDPYYDNWLDYRAAGVDSAEALEERAIDVLRGVELAGDVYRFGLAGTLSDDKATQGAIDKVLAARKLILEKLEDPKLAALVEPWDEQRYNESASVAENVLFGRPLDATFEEDNLANNPYMLSVLEKAELTQTFLETGRKVAATMVELFADLPPGHEFFDQYSFISADDLPEFESLVARVDKQGFDALDEAGRAKLMALPFKLIPARHRLGVVDDAFQDKVLEARRLFAAELPEDERGSVAFFDAKAYNAAATIQDNVLFGKVRYGQSGAVDKVQALLEQVIDEADLRGLVIATGLDRSVGVAGGRLSSAQRQKLALARAVLKQPDVLLIAEATSALDGHTQGKIHDRLLDLFKDRGLIWAPHRPSLASGFEEVIVLKDGRVAERGRYEELADKEDGALRRLIEHE